MRPARSANLRPLPPARPIRRRIRVIREYADDETNTETATVLQMHVAAALAAAAPRDSLARRSRRPHRVRLDRPDGRRSRT